MCGLALGLAFIACLCVFMYLDGQRYQAKLDRSDREWELAGRPMPEFKGPFRRQWYPDDPDDYDII